MYDLNWNPGKNLSLIIRPIWCRHEHPRGIVTSICSILNQIPSLLILLSASRPLRICHSDMIGLICSSVWQERKVLMFCYVILFLLLAKVDYSSTLQHIELPLFLTTKSSIHQLHSSYLSLEVAIWPFRSTKYTNVFHRQWFKQIPLRSDPSLCIMIFESHEEHLSISLREDKEDIISRQFGQNWR